MTRTWAIIGAMVALFVSLTRGAPQLPVGRYVALPPIAELGSSRVDLGNRRVRRIFLHGMTYSKPNPWSHPRDYSMRFFIGDELGRIRLDYADGSTQIFPLILGQGIWWGSLFRDYPEPFATDARLREALAGSLRLYPPAPVQDGNFLAVIIPQAAPIRSLTLEASPVKWGVPRIAGITIESSGEHAALSSELQKFIDEKALLPLGEDRNQASRQLNELRHAKAPPPGEVTTALEPSAPTRARTTAIPGRGTWAGASRN